MENLRTEMAAFTGCRVALSAQKQHAGPASSVRVGAILLGGAPGSMRAHPFSEADRRDCSAHRQGARVSDERMPSGARALAHISAELDLSTSPVLLARVRASRAIQSRPPECGNSLPCVWARRGMVSIRRRRACTRDMIPPAAVSLLYQPDVAQVCLGNRLIFPRGP
jgi:hypothetical protein